MDNDVSIEVSFDAINELSNISTSNGIFFEFMFYIIGQMPDFLKPTLQECDELQKIVIEFSLFFLFTDGGKILA